MGSSHSKLTLREELSLSPIGKVRKGHYLSFCSLLLNLALVALISGLAVVKREDSGSHEVRDLWVHALYTDAANFEFLYGDGSPPESPDAFSEYVVYRPSTVIEDMSLQVGSVWLSRLVDRG